MAETTAKKKLVTKVASEFQVSADQIVDFLKTKGHDKVKRTSSIDEQMYAELAAHFKKELDQVEKRQKIKEQLTEKQEEKVAVKKLVDTVTVERPHVPETKSEPQPIPLTLEKELVQEDVTEQEAETSPSTVETPSVEPETLPQTATSEPPSPFAEEPSITVEGKKEEVEVPPSAATPQAPPVEQGKQPEPRPAEKVTQPSPVETTAKVEEPPTPPKREEKGLKIRGRMDLRTGRLITEEEMRMRKELEEAEKKTKEAEKLLESESQSQKKKKKKKKKIREATTVTVPAPETETEDESKKRKKKKEAAAAGEEVGDVEVDGETESMAAGNYLSSLCGSR